MPNTKRAPDIQPRFFDKVGPDTPEPPHGTVVMLNGLTGTAYQKFFSDGLFHGVSGRVLSFDSLRDFAKGRDDTYIILMGDDEGVRDIT